MSNDSEAAELRKVDAAWREMIDERDARIAALEQEVAELKNSNVAFVIEAGKLRNQLTLARAQVREQAAMVAENYAASNFVHGTAAIFVGEEVAAAIRTMPLEG